LRSAGGAWIIDVAADLVLSLAAVTESRRFLAPLLPVQNFGAVMQEQFR
jgi:hypothetical protein